MTAAARALARVAMVAMAAAALLSACASLPPADGEPSHAMTDTAQTTLGRLAAQRRPDPPDQSAFHLLADNVDALIARVLLTEKAERSLDLQYYIWHDDATGRSLAHAVLRAADRGVRVRVLLDDIGVGADDNLLLAVDAHPAIEVRIFNPVASRAFRRAGALLEFSRVNRRMHNKALIADNQAAIVGGRNIGDEYFGASPNVSFGDLDVLTHGPIVREVSGAFDAYWNSAAAYPVGTLTGRSADPEAVATLRARLDALAAAQQDHPYAVHARERLRQVLAEPPAAATWGRAALLYDDPGKITRAADDTAGHLVPQLRALNMQPQQTLLIVSPYFVPGEAGVAWLRALRERGVAVTVLTNSLAATDVAAVHAGYKRYRETLLRMGVTLYEVKPMRDPDTLPGTSGTSAKSAKSAKSASTRLSAFGSSRASLHAKTFVADDSTVFIGSMNLDPRSVQLNTELGVVCVSPALAAQVAGAILPNLGRIAWRLAEENDPERGRQLIWIDEANPDAAPLTTEPESSVLRRVGVWFMGLFPIESQL
ncbi:phospholipase D family protein [Cupriavidus campinensis]|uniref:Phospholipase D family protein n=2 Tax=Cupriavidus campinensis TaxID=151783 RepID=A0AAE9I051_9BURK|nr:phospholipase D family protein [Cupriavidus campinensis]URF03532.1 phospholipase D family protein [Cupriavidus campinensis]